jgi:DNA polymerase I-like protein with 3'-5' exonuclease and polymerase domains
MSKRGVHATNYGITARNLATSLGITVHEAERFQQRWFSAHPGISDWQSRIADSLATTRSVANKFGFVRRYFGRIEGILPEALAWIPQSTVALVIAKALINIDENLPHSRVQPLLQTHDSLTIQFLSKIRDQAIAAIKEQMQILVPYDDPLIIGVEAKTSAISWGECAA